METVKARKLPVFTIEGTAFYVDVRLNELREVAAPANRISLDEIQELEAGDVAGLAYDMHTKNICQELVDPDNIPSYIKLVIIPPLIALDPIGLARRHGLADDAFAGKTIKQPAQEKSKKHKRGRHL